MTRALRAYRAAAHYAHEAAATRDPLAISTAARDLDTATRRLAAQQERAARAATRPLASGVHAQLQPTKDR